jgi:hypothetical protein
MWAVTGWVVVTWLKMTIALAAAVAVAWLAFGAGSGAFVLACIGAGVGELYLSRQLCREWADEARITCWWWSR